MSKPDVHHADGVMLIDFQLEYRVLSLIRFGNIFRLFCASYAPEFLFQKKGRWISLSMANASFRDSLADLIYFPV